MMRTTGLFRIVTMLTLVTAFVLTGCSSMPCCGEPKAEAAPAPAPAPKAAPAPAPAPTGNTASMAFPSAVRTGSGLECCALVVLDKSAPSEVAVGQSFDYTLKVTNRGNLEVRDVTITDVLPGGFKLASSNPAASGTSGDKTMWNVGSLKPGESKTVTVTGAASGVGELVNCSTVTYVPYICVATKVVQPALKLTKTAPAEVLLCDTIPVKIVVTNTGTGAAQNVVVNDDLPKGLTTLDGKDKVSIPVGTLAGGQSKEINLTLKAAAAGNYTNKAVATADGNLTANDSSATKVLEPKLTISKSGPKVVYLGRDVTYSIKVANTGTGEARSTVVTDTLPAGVTLVNASAGGTASGGNVVWNLGTLKPGDSKDLSVTVRGSGMGKLLNKASASATCAGDVAATAETEIAGIPAILLEVIDINDPVEVGQNETYVITATNQGSLAGKNVKITCTLEDAQEGVSVSGATKGTISGKKVTFEALPSLAPGAKAEWRVVIKALKAGDIRFAVEMNEDQLQRPVNETEATNQYQ